jgi:hypothetical protein
MGKINRYSYNVRQGLFHVATMIGLSCGIAFHFRRSYAASGMTFGKSAVGALLASTRCL